LEDLGIDERMIFKVDLRSSSISVHALDSFGWEQEPEAGFCEFSNAPLSTTKKKSMGNFSIAE
jgi:hypothetical protein